MSFVRAGRLLSGAALCFGLSAGPAPAAETWVFGSSLISLPNIVAYFARYVAPGEPGQMVIRCETNEGVSIDAGGVNLAGPGGGQQPTDGPVAIRLTWPAEGGAAPRVVTVDALGDRRIRSDGAVIVTFSGPSADEVAKALAEPLDKVEVVVGDVAAEIRLDGKDSVMATLSRACPAWPD